jgi:hypothetical protein
MKSLLQLSSLLMLAVLLTGCASYQLGSMLPDDIKTVYVPTFVNKTSEPMIETEATQAAIRELQKDGSLKVVGTREEADTLLAVTLTDYQLTPLKFERDLNTTADQYRLTLTAQVVLTRRTTDKVVSENPRIQGEADFPVAGDFTTSKKQGLPSAAEDLSHNIVESIVETW